MKEKLEKIVEYMTLNFGKGLMIAGTAVSYYNLGKCLASSNYECLDSAIIGLAVGAVGCFIEEGICKPSRKYFSIQ